MKLDTGPNTWTVTGRNGVERSFKPLATWIGTYAANVSAELNAATQYRWLSASVTDTHGNQVTYDYACDGIASAQCYPDKISYNGTTIQFYRAARTPSDVRSFATGTMVGTAKDQITAVSVATGGQMARAYAITYEASPSTGLGRITSVSEFGRDAAVTAAGAVTGSKLPGHEFAYSDLKREFVKEDWLAKDVEADFFIDANGDGRADIGRSSVKEENWCQGRGCEREIRTCRVSYSASALSGASKSKTLVAIKSASFDCLEDKDLSVYIGDFDGDGSAEFNGKYNFGVVTSRIPGRDNDGLTETTTYPVKQFDFNGDGKQDLFRFGSKNSVQARFPELDSQFHSICQITIKGLLRTTTVTGGAISCCLKTMIAQEIVALTCICQTVDPFNPLYERRSIVSPLVAIPMITMVTAKPI